ncbi:MAG: hypothetical protein BRD55_04170 [Bacteroidetes bacterium SW_9_63_38]|nr:MAG: hypothetical protein BRD55_04170 [Bacteroidetes bacterium SW_9_63_38]
MISTRLSLLCAALLFPLVLAGCDAAGGDTATFNANTSPAPVAEYLFEYDSDDQVDGQGLVKVTSGSSDNLGDVLQTLGFSRSSIVSAKIDSVEFIQVSNPKEETSTQKFVFDNLLKADVFLGTSESGLQIASGSFDPDDESEEVLLGITNKDATQVVQNGATKAFLRLGTNGDITRTDRVRAKVYYEITVSGV